MISLDVTKKIDALYKEYNIRIGKREELKSQRELIQSELSSIDVGLYEKSNSVLKKISESRREAKRLKLQELGTVALQYTLGPEYEMIIEIPENKAKPQAEVYIYNKEKDEKALPNSESGGGITDILGCAMRTIVMQSITEPAINGPLIFDEPFKMVSSEYIPEITEFLKKISKEFGRQIIFVTHNNYIAESCDQIISVDMDENKHSFIKYEKGVYANEVEHTQEAGA